MFINILIFIHDTSRRPFQVIKLGVEIKQFLRAEMISVVKKFEAKKKESNPSNFQKQSPCLFFETCCSERILRIYRKAPVMEKDSITVFSLEVLRIFQNT